MEFWHNPRCAKSREALALLRAKGVEPSVRDYLRYPPTHEELKHVIDGLALTSARALMRTKEAIYKELGLKAVTEEAALVDAMANHPKLIERPVLINGSKVALGRPPERILDAV